MERRARRVLVEEEGVEERWKREVVEGGRRWGSVSSCRVEYC